MEYVENHYLAAYERWDSAIYKTASLFMTKYKRYPLLLAANLNTLECLKKQIATEIHVNDPEHYFDSSLEDDQQKVLVAAKMKSKELVGT